MYLKWVITLHRYQPLKTPPYECTRESWSDPVYTHRRRLGSARIDYGFIKGPLVLAKRSVKPIACAPPRNSATCCWYPVRSRSLQSLAREILARIVLYEGPCRFVSITRLVTSVIEMLGARHTLECSNNPPTRASYTNPTRMLGFERLFHGRLACMSSNHGQPVARVDSEIN